MLNEDQLGFNLLADRECVELGSQSEDDKFEELVCRDPTESEHYMPPHPNDPP